MAPKRQDVTAGVDDKGSVEQKILLEQSDPLRLDSWPQTREYEPLLITFNGKMKPDQAFQLSAHRRRGGI